MGAGASSSRIEQLQVRHTLLTCFGVKFLIYSICQKPEESAVLPPLFLLPIKHQRRDFSLLFDDFRHEQPFSSFSSLCFLSFLNVLDISVALHSVALHLAPEQRQIAAEAAQRKHKEDELMLNDPETVAVLKEQVQVCPASSSIIRKLTSPRVVLWRQRG